MVYGNPWTKKDLPEGAKVITSTWSYKKKSNSTYHGQLNARGFKQIAGKHFNPTSNAVPVINGTTVRIVLVLMLLADWMARIYDVKGAFMKGKFEDCKKISGKCHKVWNTTIGDQKY